MSVSREGAGDSGLLVDALGRREADRMGAAVVARLRDHGIRPGSMVAFSAPNSPKLLAAIFGCLRGGYAPLVLSAVLTESERDELLNSVSSSLTVDEAQCDALTQPLDVEKEPVELDDYFHCRPLHFTSGTSGRPKAVWSGWHAPGIAGDAQADEDRIWNFTSTDRHLVCAPLSHSAPLRFALFTLLAGGSVLVPSRFDVGTVSRLMSRKQVNTTFMAPAHLQRLLKEDPPERPEMRLVAHAGSPCPTAVKEAALAAFGDAAVVEFYGSTEGQFTVCRSAEWRERPTSVGKARPGRELRTKQGEIWCRAPGFARFEYWGDPAKTAAAWDGEWFSVGDLGRIDDDGYLHLDGRRSDLIISGGVNVYPAEVERILGAARGVDKICVFGVPDPDWGSRVCAVVSGDITEAELRAYAHDHLAPYKRPKTIHLTDALPMTHSGKIDRSRVPGLLKD